MDKLKQAEGYLRKAYDALKSIEDPSDEQAWLYLEIGLLLHDLQVLDARDRGSFYIGSQLELN